MAKVDIFFQSTKLMGKKWVERAKCPLLPTPTLAASRSNLNCQCHSPESPSPRLVPSNAGADPTGCQLAHQAEYPSIDSHSQYTSKSDSPGRCPFVNYRSDRKQPIFIIIGTCEQIKRCAPTILQTLKLTETRICLLGSQALPLVLRRATDIQWIVVSNSSW